MSKPSGKQKMSPQVLIALITAIGTVLVALISVVPSLISKSTLSSTAIPKINFVATEENLYTVDGSSFSFNQNNQFVISGSFNKPVYANLDLPQDFSATIKFQIDSTDTEFSVGLGNGTDWGPNYRFRLSTKGFSFKKATSNEIDSDLFLLKDESTTLSANTSYNIVFERQEGVVRLYVNGNLWDSIGGEKDEVKQMPRLYITTNLGTTLIETFTIEEK